MLVNIKRNDLISIVENIEISAQMKNNTLLFNHIDWSNDLNPKWINLDNLTDEQLEYTYRISDTY